MSKTIALAGQFDTFIPKLIHWLCRENNHCQFTGITHSQYRGVPKIIWRTCSLLRARNTTHLLDDTHTLIYFALTPPDKSKTPEGYARDVALASAVNIAKCAQQSPNIRIILVTRFIPETDVLPPCYSFWHNLISIFRETCTNLTIIQTAPILSDSDSIALALYERCLNSPKDNISADDRSVFHPIAEAQLFKTLEQCIQENEIEPHYSLIGESEITPDEWMQTIRKAIPRKLLTRRFHAFRQKLNPEHRLRAELLDETLSLLPKSDQILPAAIHLSSSIRHLTEDISDDDNPTVYLEKNTGIFPHPDDSPCYVQRVLDRPRRSVSEIADLLMEWMPRYFQRMLSVENICSNRVLCRLSRIPLLEIEKHMEAPNRCYLNMRCPWTVNVHNPARLVVMTTGRPDAPDLLMIIIEETPEFHPIKLGFRALLLAFGQYLKEYGCGD